MKYAMHAAKLVGGGCLAGVMLHAGTLSAAQPEGALASIAVKRGTGAQDCPSARELAAAVDKVLGFAAVDGSGSTANVMFDVEVSSSDAGYRAILKARGVRSGERRIDDIGSTCAGLADALAVTIAIIVDDERAARSKPRDTLKVVAGPVHTKERPWRRASAGFHAGLAVGVFERAVPVGALEASYDFGDLFAMAGVLWAPEQKFELAPGSAHISLLAGYARLCTLALGARDELRLGLCVHVTAGALQGRGDGYSVDHSATRPWIAPGATVSTRGPLAGAAGWAFDSSLVVPVHEERFIIERLGTAHDPASLGLVMTVGLWLSI
jgi:hypothetical protein